MRAVRCDKLVYAAMEATLQLFLRHDLLETHATLRLLTSSVEVIRQRAERVLQQLSPQTIEHLRIRIENCQSQFGSGALPLETLPSAALVLKSSSLSADDLSRRLRTGEPPIIGYIQDDEVYLDMRTVFEEQVGGVVGRGEGVGRR
jgi:L-seryl-tRNA(Ser) seleniumtransferase